LSQISRRASQSPHRPPFPMQSHRSSSSSLTLSIANHHATSTTVISAARSPEHLFRGGSRGGPHSRPADNRPTDAASQGRASKRCPRGPHSECCVRRRQSERQVYGRMVRERCDSGRRCARTPLHRRDISLCLEPFRTGNPFSTHTSMSCRKSRTFHHTYPILAYEILLGLPPLHPAIHSYKLWSTYRTLSTPTTTRSAV
jgi:hypothetical protein